MAKKVSRASVSSRGNDKLLAAAKSSTDQLLTLYDNTLEGYGEEGVEKMRDEFGENVITEQDRETLFSRIIKSFVNPFTVILFVLAAVSLLTDVVFSKKPDPTAAIIIIVMVTASGIIRFIQETRSSNAAQMLEAMISTTTCVVRGGKRLELPLDEIVVGDIICLAAGDMIPADVRILSCKDLFVSESSLTGESNPVEKVSSIAYFSHHNSLQLTNLAFMGSNVVSGSAMCIVIAIGDDTHLGSVAKSLTTKRLPSSFEKGVNSISWMLIRFMFIMVPVIFFINGIFKGVIGGGGSMAWADALMFGLSIAVGLTPEMLPMIVTAGLAKGAVKMSKQKTIVKKLNSIQNFGAMDILCTDKTGTLTEDEIVLERYLDIHGKSDTRVLRHALMNSYFQTGLKNLMDLAILKHVNDEGLSDVVARYEKVDEIPFDFTRRRMSVVVKDKQGKTQLITKGAVEEMLAICTFAEYDGVMPLSEEIKASILSTVNKLNSEGMRVLAVAQKTNPAKEGLFSVNDESDMVLIGYLAFLDPPKKSAKSAISALNEHGVSVKILTGDNAEVTKCIARHVGISTDAILLGSEIEAMDEEELSNATQRVSIFAKLSPSQKVRIVRSLRDNGHVVGFMGDGINDAAAMREADVGISVDTAVDIAKESADIILLEKDLMVLERGIIEGRKTFANIVKYVKMTASSNFGNMLSVLVASAFLPFLPMIPLQILILNLIYDLSCISIPWDNVDNEYILEPRKWDATSVGRFMVTIGPISSIFDITTYVLLYFVICPSVLGGGYRTLTAEEQITFMMLFQTGWFVESLWSQTLVIHMTRTDKIPFIQSRASVAVTSLTIIAIIIGTALPFTIAGELFEMTALPLNYFPWLVGTIIAYMTLTTLIKPHVK